MDVGLEADSTFLKHRVARIDTALLAVRALVFHEARLEVGGEGVEDALTSDRLERLVCRCRRTLKRHEDHPRSLRTYSPDAHSPRSGSDWYQNIAAAEGTEFRRIYGGEVPYQNIRVVTD